MQKTKYISSIKYIRNLDFDYIETYSFQRGGKYNERVINDPDFTEFDKLKNKNNLSSPERNRLKTLYKLYGVTQYLIDMDGLFHPSAIKTGTFKKNDSLVIEFIKMMNTKINEIPNWMCAPIYRDAIVFYNSEKTIISTLNICLSCEYMQIEDRSFLNADTTVYELMISFFKKIGHQIE